MTDFEKLLKLRLMFKVPTLMWMLEATDKTIAKWLNTGKISYDRHISNINEVYEITKPLLARKEKHIEKNYGREK